MTNEHPIAEFDLGRRGVLRVGGALLTGAIQFKAFAATALVVSLGEATDFQAAVAIGEGGRAVGTLSLVASCEWQQEWRGRPSRTRTARHGDGPFGSIDR